MKYIMMFCILEFPLFGMELPETTGNILRYLHEHHQKAHEKHDNPHTTFYSGATKIPGLKITSNIPTDPNGKVELNINVFEDRCNSSDFQQALLQIIEQHRSNQAIQPDDDFKMTLRDCLFGCLSFCNRRPRRRGYQEVKDRLLEVRTVFIDDYTKLVFPNTHTDASVFMFKTVIEKSVLERYSLDRAEKQAEHKTIGALKPIQLTHVEAHPIDFPDYVQSPDGSPVDTNKPLVQIAAAIDIAEGFVLVATETEPESDECEDDGFQLV